MIKNMANDFTKQRDAKNINKIREIQKDLPPIVTQFMNTTDIQRMETSSRLGYIRDLRTFFYFLPREIPEFADTLPSKITVEQLGNLKKTDFDIYYDYLNLYIKPKYGDGDVNHADVHAPYSRKVASDLKGQTANEAPGKARKIVALRRFFKYLFDNEYIKTDYTQRIKPPKIVEKEIVYLNEEEIAKVIETVKNGFGEKKQAKFLDNSRVRDLAIMTMLLGTGMRASECVGIDLDHINLEERTVYVTRKGGKEMTLYFNASTAEALEDYLQIRNKIVPEPGSEKALFLSSQRKRISARALQNLVKKYANVACPGKKKLSPHKMRSSFGTALYNANHDIEQVANTLGHSNVNTTKKHYVHDDKENRKAAAESVDWV